jgi:hypothetical protein
MPKNYLKITLRYSIAIYIPLEKADEFLNEMLFCEHHFEKPDALLEKRHIEYTVLAATDPEFPSTSTEVLELREILEENNRLTRENEQLKVRLNVVPSSCKEIV